MKPETFDFIVKEVKEGAWFFAFSTIVFNFPTLPIHWYGRIAVFICYVIGWALFGLILRSVKKLFNRG